MFINLLIIAISVLLLFFGAEGFVRGSSALAARLKVSPFVIGLTLVAFGTSLPELIVSLEAAASGHADIALGNVIGSNTFNIAVILGISAVICPIPVNRSIIKIDAPLAFVVAAIFAFMIADGNLGRAGGISLFVGLIAYILFTLLPSRREATETVFETIDANPPKAPKSLMLNLIFIASGLAILILGSNLLVEHSTIIAKHFGVSDAVIGLTIIAAGTSMPELSTSVVAAFRKQSDIAVGNVVGSNLFNILGIAGLTCSFHPITQTEISTTDIVMMLLCSTLLIPLIWTGKRLIRAEGALLLSLYGTYLWLIWPN